MRHSLAVSFCLPFCQRMLPASAQLSNRYNLGLLTRKSHLVVDVSFPRLCSEIIGRAVRSTFPLENCKQSATLTRLWLQSSSPAKASIACRLVCRLLSLTDAAEKLTPEAIPAAAAALRGKERDPSESQDNGVIEGTC